MRTKREELNIANAKVIFAKAYKQVLSKGKVSITTIGYAPSEGFIDLLKDSKLWTKTNRGFKRTLASKTIVYDLHTHTLRFDY